MAVTYRFQMIFALGRQGWSEGFYITSADSAAAIASIGRIAAKRQALLASNAVLDGVRVSQFGVRGSTLPINVNPAPAAFGTPQPDAGTSAMFSLRLQTTGIAPDQTSVYRRNYSIRGHPDEAIGGNQVSGEYIAAKGAAAVSGYFGQLIAEKVQDQVNTKATVVAVASLASADPAQNLRLTCLGAHGLVAGQTVTIAGGVHGWKKVNGQALVVPNLGAAGPTVVTLQLPPEKTVPTFIFYPPLFVQLRVPNFATLTAYTFMRSVARDTGKPSFATVGRYKTRRLPV